MSNYDKTHDFRAKDAINAPVVGAEFQDEFDAIQGAVNSKADKAGDTFTGTLKYTPPNGVDGQIASEVVNVAYVTNGTANINAALLESRSQVVASTGSVGTPSGYIFSDDTNSGLFNPSDGTVQIVRNGTAKLQVDTNVRVIAPLNVGESVSIDSGQLILGGTGRIQGVDTVSASTDAASKSYVDGRINTVQSSINSVSSIANATLNVNQVGSLVFARWNQNAPVPLSGTDSIVIDYGGTVSGSQLSPTNDDNTRSSTLPGTCRCLGYARNTGSRDDEGDAIRSFAKTLFVRIS